MDMELFELFDLIAENKGLVLAILLPLGYVSGFPLVLFFTFRQRANPVFERVGEEVAFPKDVEQHFETAGAHFARLGFEELDTLFLPDQMANVKAVLRMFVNRPEQDAAMAVAFFVLTGNEWRLKVRYVEICTHYRDGSEVCTQNSPIVGCFPIPKNKTQAIVPHLADMTELHRAHQAICHLVANGQAKGLELDSVYGGDVAAYLSAGMTEEFEQARAIGYLRYLPTKGAREPQVQSVNPYQSPGVAPVNARYMPTIKGAYLMGWSELWPFKSLVQTRHYRRARRLLAEAGFKAVR